MVKPRKMLGDFDAPYIRSLMELIETQSRPTIASWCVDYARARLLPLWERDFPADTRPADALQAARAYLNGVVKLAKVKERTPAAGAPRARRKASPSRRARHGRSTRRPPPRTTRRVRSRWHCTAR